MHPASANFAYTTLLADLESNEFKRSYLDAALVWCRAIRQSYASPGNQRKQSKLLDYDMVAMVIGTVEPATTLLLYTCFDRILPLKPFGRAPLGVEDSRYYSVVRAKLWAFGLTEYKRVQFIDVDVFPVSNLDRYFFREHYASSTAANKKANNIMPALADIHTQAGFNSPISTAFMSLAPSMQVSPQKNTTPHNTQKNDTTQHTSSILFLTHSSPLSRFLPFFADSTRPPDHVVHWCLGQQHWVDELRALRF